MFLVIIIIFFILCLLYFSLILTLPSLTTLNTGNKSCHRFIGRAGLDRDGGLTNSRHHVLVGEGVELSPDPATDTQTAQSSGGEHGGISHAVLGDLTQASVHVATDLGERGVGKHHRQLEAATRTAGGDGHGGFNALAEHQHITRVFARQVAGDRQTCGHFPGQVFATMHGEIGVTAQKGVFEFLGEKPFAALFFEGPLDALVAGGDDFQQLDFDTERSAQVRGNLHEFLALADTAVFDVLLPPYSDAAGRPCHYYAPARGGAGGEGAGEGAGALVDLEEVPWPDSLVVDSAPYRGPKCGPGA